MGKSIHIVRFSGVFKLLIKVQRPLFWVQIPVALIAGVGVFLSIPASVSSNDVHGSSSRSLTEKLMGIDYLGAALLVQLILQNRRILVYGSKD